MRTLATLLAAAVIAAFGFTGPASADPFADVKESFTTGTGFVGDGSEALGGPSGGDGSFVTLGQGGILILQFTDNLCLDDGTGAFEFQVVEDGSDEGYTAEVGVTSVGTLPFNSGIVNGTTSFDVAGAVSFFNRIRITDDNDAVDGADIDAVECFFTLDQADIVKAIVGDDDIDIGVNNTQPFTFTITITNNTGISDGLAGLIFLDVVPAEFDVTSISVDNTTGAGDDGQDECVASSSEPTKTAGNSGGKKKQKLAPDFITITADNAGGLADGEFCIVTVNVTTDVHHGGGQSPTFTPTSCPIGTPTFDRIVLNEGVQVFDSSMNLLLQDDDSLDLDCTSNPL